MTDEGRPDSPGSRSWVSPTDRLTHVTLQTGHMAVTTRADVGDPVIRVLRPILRTALSADTLARLPAVARLYGLQADVHQGILLASILRRSDRRPVTSLVVGAHDSAGHAWHAMIERLLGLSSTPARAWMADRLQQIADPAPPPPWLLTWVHPLAPADALDWVADLERCLAWVWIEYQVGARSIIPDGVRVREPSPDGGLVDVPAAAAPAAAEESGDDLPTRRMELTRRLLAAARQSPNPATQFFARLAEAELDRRQR